MQDRIPLYPGRVTLTPVSGQANTYDMARADQPTKEGTPLNKATFLKDSTAALYRLGEDAVPDDVLIKLSDSPMKVGDIKATVRTDLGDKWLLCNGESAPAVQYPDLADLLGSGFNPDFSNMYQESDSSLTPYFWGGKYFLFSPVSGTGGIKYANTINGAYSTFNFGFSGSFSVKKVKEYQGKLCILLFTSGNTSRLLVLNSDLTYRLILLDFSSASRTPDGPKDFAFGTDYFVMLDTYVSGYYLRYYVGAMPNLTSNSTVTMTYKNISESYPWYYNYVLYNEARRKFYIFVYYNSTTRAMAIDEDSIASASPTYESPDLRYKSGSTQEVSDWSFCLEVGDYAVIFGGTCTAVYSFDQLSSESSAVATSYISLSALSYNYAPQNAGNIMMKQHDNVYDIYIMSCNNNSSYDYVHKVAVTSSGTISIEQIWEITPSDLGWTQLGSSYAAGIFSVGDYYAMCLYNNSSSDSNRYKLFFGYKESVKLPTITVNSAYAYIKAKE